MEEVLGEQCMEEWEEGGKAEKRQMSRWRK
jgi:hypothetical protein